MYKKFSLRTRGLPYTQSRVGPSYTRFIYIQPACTPQRIFLQKSNGETPIKLPKNYHNWLQAKFSAYLEVFGKFERLNKSRGSLLLLLHNLLSKSNGENGKSKMPFISFENAKFFQNFILFCFMSLLTWELGMPSLVCFQDILEQFETVPWPLTRHGRYRVFTGI